MCACGVCVLCVCVGVGVGVCPGRLAFVATPGKTSEFVQLEGY